MTYQIADEPIETSLRAYVVRPSAPLMAIMLGGAWLSWPWFAFNAIAMGSPTRRKEIGLCAAGVTETDTNRGAGPQRDAQVAPQSDHARLVLVPKQLPLQQLDGDVLITQSNLRVAESHGRRRALA